MEPTPPILIFETHATSVDNEARLASGWYDADLSPAGERQAGELGDRHRGRQIDAVYCSDLIRARRTADIAFGARGLPIHVDARLRECDYGSLTRAPAADIDARRLDCIDVPFPNGESYAQSVARVREWLNGVLRTPREHAILVIGHRATLYAFEHLLRAIPLREAIAAAWHWQPGWVYSLSEFQRFGKI